MTNTASQTAATTQPVTGKAKPDPAAIVKAAEAKALPAAKAAPAKKPAAKAKAGTGAKAKKKGK